MVCDANACEILEAELPYSLELTMSPSFVSSLFDRRGAAWVKARGAHRGLALAQPSSDRVVVSDPPDDPGLLRRLLGLWHAPFEPLAARHPLLARLASVYEGLRLPLAPAEDFTWIFVAVVLSRRTDYERFVLPWCRGIDRVAGGNPWLLIERPELVGLVGSSYQLAQLVEALRSLAGLLVEHLGWCSWDTAELAEAAARLPSLGYWRMRMLLLRCRWVGPKVADSISMVFFEDPRIFPVDVHLMAVSRRLGLLPPWAKTPDPALCREHPCFSCPARDECARALILRELGELSGWFQTVAYLHARRWCRTRAPLCDRCPLAPLCPREEAR